MFSWICPQCGREIPPSQTECPNCSGQPKAVAPAPSPTTPGAESAAYAATPPVQAPLPVAPAHAGLPTWLMSILFALAFIGLGLGAYWGVQYLRQSRTNAPPQITLENPPAQREAKTNPLQKFIEVTGIRMVQDQKKNTEVRFLVVNHSSAEISDLSGNVTVWARTPKSEEERVGTFSFRLSSLGPYESREMAALLNTKLKVYELPDWQNLTSDVQVLSPQTLE